jgi:hypothetical protein
MTVETFTFTGPELDALLAKRSLHDIEETNRRANASWALMCEKMVAAEREACAKLCEQHGYEHYCGNVTDKLAETIQNRGNT